jgi:hypothetical protein
MADEKLYNGHTAQEVIDLMAQLAAMYDIHSADEWMAITRRGYALLKDQAYKLDTLREALDCLLPGLVLDLRYAEPDDDTDAMRSRIKTVTDALEATK